MPVSRRDFLKTAAVSAGALLLPSALAGRARAAGGEPVLVAIFLRGGADSLGMVAPLGDPYYAQIRPTIALTPATALPIGNGFYGFHPAFAPLLPAFQAGRVAVVHATGSHDPTRSHFDAQDFMERGAPNDFSVYDGWLNRTLAAIGASTSLSGVTFSGAKALSLSGPAPSVAFTSLNNFRLSGGNGTERRAALQSMYQTVSTTLVGRSVGELFQSLDQIAGIQNTSTVAYPNTGLARTLRDVAALIRADLGVRVVAVNVGGWDHHEREPENMARTVAELAGGLAAFDQDLGGSHGRTLTITMTEFGRTAEENGSAGTDHGHGSLSVVMGAGIRGGRVLTKNDTWPGLAPNQRFEGRDLAVTTDFRDLFAEVLHRHMGLSSLGSVFPRFAVSTANYPGLYS